MDTNEHLKNISSATGNKASLQFTKDSKNKTMPKNVVFLRANDSFTILFMPNIIRKKQTDS